MITFKSEKNIAIGNYFIADKGNKAYGGKSVKYKAHLKILYSFLNPMFLEHNPKQFLMFFF